MLYEVITVDVTSVGIGGRRITAAHGLVVETDISLDELNDPDSYDGLVFPGGLPGADNLAAEKKLLDLIEIYNKKNRIIAAICASPGVILTKTSVLDGKTATCYPGFEKRFGKQTAFSENRVVVDGNRNNFV